jgi:diphthamide synthase (EF-2-diphthine--ammonia ligase)
MQEKVIVSWSGGKDSTLALQEILQANRYKVAGFLTTVNRDFNRISIHGVRSLLLEQQANSLGYPLKKLFVPKDVNNLEYEDSLLRILKKNRNSGISSIVFGDIFLEDVRKYRVRILSKLGLKSLSPLWGEILGNLLRVS